MPAAGQGKRSMQVKAGNRVDTIRSRPDDSLRKQDLKGRPTVHLAVSAFAREPQPSTEPDRLLKAQLQSSPPAAVLTTVAKSDSPRQATTPQDDVSRAEWLVKMRRDQVIKFSTIRSLHLANGSRMEFGNETHGHFSTGDEDGVWDNLREAQIYTYRLADTLYAHLGGTLPGQLSHHLSVGAWAVPLKALMESAALQVLGPSAKGMLAEMKGAIKRVCSANEEYDECGDAVLDDLIDAYARCMAILSSLLRELAGLVDSKSQLRDAQTRAYIQSTRTSVKLYLVRRTLQSLPTELIEYPGGVLSGLLDDTLGVFAAAQAIIFHAEDRLIPPEKNTDPRRKAMTVFYRAARKLAGTDIAQLKAEGLKTNRPDDSWTVAAKEGLVIYMRGPPVFMAPFPDLPLRMLDYVLHVLAALALLVVDQVKEAERANGMALALRLEKAGEVASSCVVPDLDKGGLLADLDPWLRERWLSPGAKNVPPALSDNPFATGPLFWTHPEWFASVEEALKGHVGIPPA